MPTATNNSTQSSTWQRNLADAVRTPAELLNMLELDSAHDHRPQRQDFPLLVPSSYIRRMQTRAPADPLLRQVLPLDMEQRNVPGFAMDAVDDAAARRAPGCLQKYEGRALLIAAGACAVHCRYCFRRHYPYGEEPRRIVDWEPAFERIAADDSLHEVILSGGDPLMLTDQRLRELVERLDDVTHLKRLRIHTRMPIVLPDRVTPEFLNTLATTRLTSVVVMHANHPRELVDDCADSLKRLAAADLMLLNQAVLLRGVNDSVDVLAELSERLIDLGVLPYYLHQLDRVAGVGHFEVPVEEGRALIDALRRRLPGYAVPRYVQEVAGEEFKVPL